MYGNRHVISFPQHCDNQILSYKRVITDYWKVLNTASAKEIIFECGDVRVIHPLGLNILALLIRNLLRENSRKVFFVHPTDRECKTGLEAQGFYEEFPIQHGIESINATPRSSSMGLRRMDACDYLYLEMLADWLNHNLSLPEKNIKEAISTTLSETVQNVVDHSQSDIGCYISAQSYPNEEKLLFSVADYGIGFLKTLCDHYSSLNNNTEAIALAIQSGISSKSKIRNAGAGLDILSGFLKQRGNLEIISFDGIWRQSNDGELSDTLPFSFPGSCVNIEFNNKKIADLRLDDDEINR